MYEFPNTSSHPHPVSTIDPDSHGEKPYGSVLMQKRGRMGTEGDEWGKVPPRHIVTPGQDYIDKWKSCHEEFHGIFINV